MPCKAAVVGLRDNRLIRLFTERRQWVRQVVVTSAAGGVAWIAADRLIQNGGLVAAISAVLTVQVSVHKSLREGFGQIVGTGIGALVALGSISLFGPGVITVFLTVGLSLVAARALRLGNVASINVPITALIVTGPGLAETTAENRTLQTVIGALIAIGFSYFTHPQDPAGRTVNQIAKLATDAADLLGVMSEGVADGFDQDEAAEWLAQGRKLVASVPELRQQAIEARQYAKWSPLAAQDEAEDLYTRAVALDHAVEQVRTIARTLFDAAVEGGLPQSINGQIADALSAASYAMSASVVELHDADDVPLDPEITDDVRSAGQELTHQLREDADDYPTVQFARGISIASNLERLADSIDQSTPAIHGIPEPEPPTEELVLKLPRRKRRKRR